MFELKFKKNETKYLELIELLITVRDYKIKLTDIESHELAKYELELKLYIHNLNNKTNIIRTDIKTKTMLSYNNIDYKISDKDLFNEELKIIYQIKKYTEDLYKN